MAAISVIVPSLDAPLLSDTLAALAAQQPGHGDTEVIVVGRQREGWPATGTAGVRLVDTGSALSPAAARNRGVAAASGRLLCFTDADCRPQPSWLNELERALGRAPVAGGAVVFSLVADRWAVADNIASFHELLPDRPAEDRTQRPLGSLNLAMTREAWEIVGPFDETLTTSEDLDWVWRGRAAGLATAFAPAARIEHAAVRTGREALVAHAAWYGRHFPRFRARHPDAFGRGPTWRSRRRLAVAAPLKAWAAACGIYLQHPMLRPAWRALPAVALFKRAWYRAVLAAWEDA